MDREVGAPVKTLGAEAELEIKLLLEAIYHRFHYDFRKYAMSSLRRRLARACDALGCATVSRLQERVLHDASAFPVLLAHLTIQVSDMFRDPAYFLAIRRKIVPILRTYPSLKLWVAGCSMGEEAYSFAILLHEEGLLERTTLYATDINGDALRTAQLGVYELKRIARFSENYQRASGQRSLSAYYTARYDAAVFDRALAAHIVFSDHSLSTDSAFGEMQMISCRNVLIYFDRELQDRALGLFQESLCHNGFLGLGAKESLRFSKHGEAFRDVAAEERIYQRIA
jgi:chemotaxis protein methyltransferase CheR